MRLPRAGELQGDPWGRGSCMKRPVLQSWTETHVLPYLFQPVPSSPLRCPFQVGPASSPYPHGYSQAGMAQLHQYNRRLPWHPVSRGIPEFGLPIPHCTSLSPFFFFTELRLVGGPSRCRGRLEVMHSGSWGSVCDDDWDVVDANVVCRQLGCGLALPVPRPLAFGQGRGPIFLDNVECRGQEASLSECGSRGWGVHNCFHYEDVAVLCDGEERKGDCGG